MKKGCRFGFRVICILLFGVILYNLHLLKLTTKVVKKQKNAQVHFNLLNQENGPSFHGPETKYISKTFPDDIKFEERDMFDENGQPFQIVIWMKHHGKPGYVANPIECLGNISCQITYDTTHSDTAHAFVFKADHIYGNYLPSKR